MKMTKSTTKLVFEEILLQQLVVEVDHGIGCHENAE